MHQPDTHPLNIVYHADMDKVCKSRKWRKVDTLVKSTHDWLKHGFSAIQLSLIDLKLNLIIVLTKIQVLNNEIGDMKQRR